MRKSQIPIGVHPTDYLVSDPQNCRGNQKQGKSRNYHNQGETLQLHVIWYSGILEQRKDISKH